ncbi:hypothetical protein [Thiohalobacter sp.]|uniref:hypothetical protein n=1 Tax=Thiohalobacter sp. TaxID=2025948 RepID=UPI00261011CC|nr:hypothetical protein [Thiohalobacter sp.]
MSEERRTFKAGDQVRLTLMEEGDGAGDDPLYVADYTLDNAGGSTWVEAAAKVTRPSDFGNEATGSRARGSMPRPAWAGRVRPTT